MFEIFLLIYSTFENDCLTREFNDFTSILFSYTFTVRFVTSDFTINHGKGFIPEICDLTYKSVTFLMIVLFQKSR